MPESKFKVPKSRFVIVHGEEVNDVTEIIPPSTKKPYWTLIKGEGDFILATGDVSITHKPGAEYVIKFAGEEKA